MFQFTLRELLLLTSLVAVTTAWLWETHARRITRSHAEVLRMVVARAREDYEAVLADLNNGTSEAKPSLTDWGKAEEPIP